ncbi:sigma-70 family RNA polymerase sigma factor [Glycomyces sp. NRRL B-16210]|uniref:sigma-70 family RNA polymerase sigma factor n=1 Tax=Glycomyces sp. NRRL B-16210 TaxID=1463821 RepID=UPI0004BF0B26|nr:sigma-70 family RNA polymerase sigma factor [Glycomyces sp. NRRL B-16210]
MDAATVERFEANRDRLASLAYRLLGSAADAEDAVQDAFLRWQSADRERIEVPEAWLTKVVTNLALDRLRSARARRERAVGEWLPEPLLDGDPMLGPADTFEQRESVTLAVLMLMERLPPVERAVYVLREAFSHSHAEIAEILDISESASQQHAHRARRRVAAERVSGEIDRAAARAVVEAFVEAAASGDTGRLVALLTEDATAVTDGAGLSGRLLRETDPERIAAILRAGFKPTETKRRIAGGSPGIHAGLVNGSPALIAAIGDRVVGIVVFAVREGRIANVHGTAGQDRLGRLTEQWRRTDHEDPILASW